MPPKKRLSRRSSSKAPREAKTARRLIRASGWGVLDQTLLSAVNFLTLVLLARHVSSGSFGAFTLVYGVMLMANHAQFAFVTQPHNVIGASLTDFEYRAYTRSLLVVQLFFSAGLAAAAGVVAVGAYQLEFETALILAAMAALPLWQLQEFIRRVLYTEGRQAAAFANDLLSYGGQATAVAGLTFAGALTAPSALFALALTAAGASVFGLGQIRASLRGAHFSRLAVSESLAFGKWLAASIASHWTSTQAYLYIAAAVLGVAVTGALKALQIVLSPLHVLMFSLSTMLPIRLSRTLMHEAPDRREQAFRRDARFALRITFPFVAAYCGSVALFSDQILSFLYGSTYEAYGRVLVIFAAYYVLLYLAQFAGALLTARRQTDRLFLANAAAAIVAMVAAWPLMHAFGAEGAAVLLLVSAGVLSVALWWPSWAKGGQTPDESRRASAIFSARERDR